MSNKDRTRIACQKGHLFTEDNTYITPKNGHWQCRECGRLATERLRASRVARVPIPRILKTHCVQGHAYTESNTIRFNRNGKPERKCRQCSLDRTTQWRRSRGAKAMADYRRDKVACVNGHLYTDETTKIDNRGGRVCNICAKSGRTKAAYGVTTDQFNVMKQVADHCCGICGIHETAIVGRVKLVIDHDHATKETRGILCRDCNLAIGLLREKKENFLKAIRYLDLHNYAYSLKVQNEPKLVRETGPEADRIWAFVEKASLAARETSG